MSLTSFLKQQDVKARFKQEFSKPKLSVKPNISASVLTLEPQLVGTAFDYLLRFYVKYLNPQAQQKEWVAESSLRLLRQQGHNHLYEQGHLIVTRTKENYAAFEKTGQFTTELLQSTLSLAKLDFFFRSGKISENLQVINEQDIQDLRQLIEVVDPELFKSKGQVLLNPSWGIVSALVGGADGDLIIDDLLIDIKTVKNFILERDDFDQLMGYYILSVIYQQYHSDATNIKRLGIYFSRYSYLYVFNVEDIVNPQSISHFIEWFVSRAKNH